MEGEIPGGDTFRKHRADKPHQRSSCLFVGVVYLFRLFESANVQDECVWEASFGHLTVLVETVKCELLIGSF